MGINLGEGLAQVHRHGDRRHGDVRLRRGIVTECYLSKGLFFQFALRRPLVIIIMVVFAPVMFWLMSMWMFR
jgi:hypothetical protein